MSGITVRLCAITALLCGTLVIAQQPVGDSFAPQQASQPQADGYQGTPDPKQEQSKYLQLKVRAQGKPEPKPGSLEEMLAEAQRNNPDIRVAEAKLREAEAELNRTRLQVMQKIVIHQKNVEALKATVAEYENRLQRMRALEKNRVISAEEISSIQEALSRAKAELAKAEAELPYLLGKSQLVPSEKSAAAPRGAGGNTSFWLDAGPIGRGAYVFDASTGKPLGPLPRVEAVPRGSMADKILKALDTPIKVDFKGMTAQQILEALLEKMEGVPSRIVTTVDKFVPHQLGKINSEEGEKRKFNLQFQEPLPLGAALQAFQDVTENNRLQFVIRDYGILVTSEGNVPSDSQWMFKVWKSPPPKAPEKESEPSPKK